ncbi:hypothetical protein GQ457_01G024850 [Hibiscus cannabinus]
MHGHHQQVPRCRATKIHPPSASPSTPFRSFATVTLRFCLALPRLRPFVAYMTATGVLLVFVRTDPTAITPNLPAIHEIRLRLVSLWVSFVKHGCGCRLVVAALLSHRRLHLAADIERPPAGAIGYAHQWACAMGHGEDPTGPILMSLQRVNMSRIEPKPMNRTG